MLLYVFTNDGGNREDGTVYYAKYMLIKAKKSEHAKVKSLIEHLLSENASTAVKNTNKLREKVYHESNLRALAKKLKKHGYKTKDFGLEILTNEY